MNTNPFTAVFGEDSHRESRQSSVKSGHGTVSKVSAIRAHNTLEEFLRANLLPPIGRSNFKRIFYWKDLKIEGSSITGLRPLYCVVRKNGSIQRGLDSHALTALLRAEG